MAATDCQCMDMVGLQRNAPVCLHELRQGRVPIERLHPDPRMAAAHQLIQMVDREWLKCISWSRWSTVSGCRASVDPDGRPWVAEVHQLVKMVDREWLPRISWSRWSTVSGWSASVGQDGRPWVAAAHQLIQMVDREWLKCISWSRWSTRRHVLCSVFILFWQLKQRSASAFLTMTQRHAVISLYISVKRTASRS